MVRPASRLAVAMLMLFSAVSRLCQLVCIALTVVSLANAEETISSLPASCTGYDMDGKPANYVSSNLHERINGESELFFSYGFKRLVAVNYINKNNPEQSFEVEVYELGSVLDAFGMFANYRRPGDPVVTVGGEGSSSEVQLFFYQGPYLVKLQATSTNRPAGAVFETCAGQISNKLPGGKEPEELAALDITGVVKATRRYIAKSVLGYDFFQRGIVAERNDGALVFVLLEESAKAAEMTLNRYEAYLRGTDSKVKARKPVISGKDPLYGPVHVQVNGRFLLGATRTKDIAAATLLVKNLAAQLAKVAKLK